MNNKEFSEQFDTLLDSYKINNDYGTDENLYILKLDEYEKSVYLTNAQNDTVIELYSGRGITNTSYEESEELRRYLSNLNVSKVLTNLIPYNEGLSNNSVRCLIGNDVLWITQEQCKISSENNCLNNTWVDTFPIKRDEYNRIKNNPFKNNKIWRVDIGIGEVELISKSNIGEYKVTYLRRPKPIILEDLDDLTIDNISNESECELHVMLHKYILEKAVMEAYRYMATKFETNKNKTQE